MPYCKKCGSQIDEQARFCPVCGNPVNQIPIQPAVRRNRPFPIFLVVIIVVGVVVFGLILVPFLMGLWNPFGTIVGSGNVVTQNQPFSDFSVVRVSSGFDFTITQSNTFSVKTTTDENIQSYLQVSKSGNTLTVGLKPGYGITTTTLRVQITMPSLSRLEISGGTHGTAEGFISTVGFEIDASGGSRAQVSGRASDLVATASGGSQIDSSDFAVTNANVNLSGGSQANVNASGTINGDLSGGSRLFYSGNPNISNITVSGGSTILKE